MSVSPEISAATSAIYDYMNYRAFLKDRFAQLKAKNPLFSYRSFSRRAGAKSSGFLKLVMDGRRNLEEGGIEMVARGFRLSEPEKKYFECLVKFNQAGTHEDKNVWFQKVIRHKRFLTSKRMTNAQYALFSRWYYVAILELLRVPSEKPKTLEWIRERIYPEVGIPEVKRAILDLKTLELVESDPAEGLRRKDSMLSTADEVRSLSVANFHIQMSELAAKAVTNHRAREREFTTLTVAVSERAFQKAKDEIRKFRDRLHSMLEQETRETGDTTDFVGHMNLQLFRLTKKGGPS